MSSKEKPLFREMNVKCSRDEMRIVEDGNRGNQNQITGVAWISLQLEAH